MRKIFSKILYRLAPSDWYWKYRDYFEPGYADRYFNPGWDTPQNHAFPFIQKIIALNPASVYEPGCGAGTGLFLIAKKLPSTHCLGMDISKAALKAGQQYIAQNKITNVALINANEKPKENSFEVVFTNQFLIYKNSEEAEKLIEEYKKLATKAILFLEWHDPHKKRDGHSIHNFAQFFKGELEFEKIKGWDANWDRYGYMIKATKGNNF